MRLTKLSLVEDAQINDVCHGRQTPKSPLSRCSFGIRQELEASIGFLATFRSPATHSSSLGINRSRGRGKKPFKDYLIPILRRQRSTSSCESTEDNLSSDTSSQGASYLAKRRLYIPRQEMESFS